MNLVVDSAINSELDKIGEILGQNDSSGARRLAVIYLRDEEWQKASKLLKITEEEVKELRQDLVSRWGEPIKKD